MYSEYCLAVILMLIAYLVYKDKQETYRAINWKDATTIGEPIYRDYLKTVDSGRECVPINIPCIPHEEAEYEQEQECRNIKDDVLATKHTRKPLKNEGHAFVKHLTNSESFEQPHYSNTCDEFETRKYTQNLSKMTPRSSVGLYHVYEDTGY